MKKFLFIVLALSATLFLTGYAPAESGSQVPGFWTGAWQGLLAPYTLLLRLFMEIQMYALPNSGWWYDFGFLLGVAASIPVGWIAAIVAIIYFIGDTAILSFLGNIKLK